MFAVIMAGGSGTRFWPVSRRKRPKQFLNITGGGPMVVETCDRLHSIIKDEEMLVILGQEHLAEAESLFNGRGISMLAEPVGRNTAPCIGLGALFAKHLGYQTPIAFLPADHFIGDPASFLDTLQAAGDLASSGGIVTLGIIPNRPETGYGYIRREQANVDAGGLMAYRVSAFVEKPGPEKALHYLNTGEYYWNGGIFVATAQTILKEINIHLPELYKGLMRLEKALGTERFESEFKAVYNGIKGVSFDYGIMEKTGEEIFVIPSDCGWSDVGSWSSLYELREQDCDEDRNLVEGEAVLIGCKESFISSRGNRPVTCLGLNNCLVVDTPDALLVADLDQSQDIRAIVERLKKDGKENLL